jgi:integrase/recombinase XerD
MAEATLFGVAREKFIEKFKKDKRSSYTILAYGNDLNQFDEFLKGKQITLVTGVRTEDIENFKKYLLEEKNYTPKSVSRKLNSIKAFFRFLASQKLINEDPAISVSHPRFTVEPPRILSKMEYRALRDTVRDNARLAAIIELLLQTGMRIGELARLELNDVLEKSIRIRAYETQPDREVPLNPAAHRALAQYLEIRPKSKSKEVFITKNHHPMNVRNIRSAIDRYFRLAGIKNATVNDLRHTFIAHQLAAGTSPVLLQQIVGHKRLSTTEKYLEFIKDKVTSTEKLEEL